MNDASTPPEAIRIGSRWYGEISRHPGTEWLVRALRLLALVCLTLGLAAMGMALLPG